MDQTNQDSLKAATSRWFWFISTALIVFAARCGEIHLYAGDTPFLDQWRVEAELILVPWLQGQLSWSAFFSPHHEHIHALTRLLTWLEAVVLGRWDPKLQCTINAVIWGGTIGLWSLWLRRFLPIIPALILTLLSVVLAALPYSWENTTWGFQVHFPLALLFITWHIHGSFFEVPHTKKWWASQVAGLLSFFTLGSMWAAPFAVLIILFWIGNFDWRRWVPAATLSILGLALMLYSRGSQPHEGALAQSVTNLPQFLAAWFVQLGWPSSWPAAGALLYSPTIILAWSIWRQKKTSPIDLVVLAICLWAAAQATAFAIARGGAWVGFVSRYGDLLALGVLANAVALWRLIQGLPHCRVRLAALLISWTCVLTAGLQWISTQGHTAYFHQHSALWSLTRSDAVKGYLETKSLEPLSRPDVRKLLYPVPETVAKILDTPGLSKLLPVKLRPNSQREKGDFVSAVAARVREIWRTLIASGIILLILSLFISRRSSKGRAPPLIASNRKTTALPWLAGMTLTALLLLLLWPMPLEFNEDQRWRKILTPEGYVGPMSFRITTPTTYTVDNLTGGASLWPEEFRNTFYGTHIDGPGFIGSAQSSTFVLGSPWIIIPFSGFPTSPGNLISLRIEDHAGNVLAEIPCQEPNPRSIGFWPVNVNEYQGQVARFVYLDGRNDDQGWIAAAPPQPAASKDVAQKLTKAWTLEKTTSAQRSLGYLIPILVLATCLSALRLWLNRQRS